MAPNLASTAGPSRQKHGDSPPTIDEPTPVWARRRNSDSAAESPWARKIVLSLDGGGVRGYASLLILEELMSKVRDLEREKSRRQQNENPETKAMQVEDDEIDEDADVAHVDSNKTSHSGMIDGLWESSAAYCWEDKAPYNPEGLISNHEGTFRPHHYFDYFVGTSTGGLSAMMLGRLQMTVQEAREQYDVVGERVFQRRNKAVKKATLGGLLLPRFKASHLEEALQIVTQRDRLDVTPTQSHSDPAANGNLKTVIERKAKNVRLANGNPQAARTAILTYGGHETHEVRMFRSYNHRAPNSTAADHKSSGSPVPSQNHTKPLDACNLPLWKVGRATTAAPTYFPEIQIGDMEFRDGGVGGVNNPVRYAYDEVKQMHWQHSPRLIVSIGTGVKPKKRRFRKKGGLKKVLKNLRDTRSINNQFKTAVLDSENKHWEFQKEIDGVNARIPNVADRVKYLRFNIPIDMDITTVKLGDWKGHKGAETKETLRNGVNQYLQTQNDQLLDCAQMLVDVRRQRLRTERWERFAKHLVYVCPEKSTAGVCEELELDSRLELRQHLIRNHGYVWKVPCKDTQGNILHEWSCFWDDCGEQHVSVFDQKKDFMEHLRLRHGIRSPKVVSREAFEEKLDDGRKIKQPSISPHATMAAPARLQTAMTMSSHFHM